MNKLLYILSLVLLCSAFSSYAKEAKKAKGKLQYKYSKRSESKGLMRGSCEIHYKEAQNLSKVSIQMVSNIEGEPTTESFELLREGTRTFHDMGNKIRFSLGEINTATEITVTLHTVQGELIPCDLEKVTNHPKKQ